jgi:hypothetical protein
MPLTENDKAEIDRLVAPAEEPIAERDGGACHYRTFRQIQLTAGNLGTDGANDLS